MNIIFAPMINYDLEEEIMGCLKLLKDEHKGKIIIMSGNKGNKENNKNNKSNKQDEEYYTVPKSTITFIKWAAGGCGALFLALLSVVGWTACKVYDLNKNILTEDSMIISDIKGDISDVNAEVDKINSKLDDSNGVKGICSRLSAVEALINTHAIKASTDTQGYVDDVSVVGNDINNSTSSFSADTCIGTDSEGKAYIAKDLIGQTILLTFDQGDKETYFLGQYNDKYHWDGYCVINTYTDGVLNGVSESNFDDGNRLNYESFYLSDNQGEWIYTDRDCKEDSNDGVSIRYKLDYDKQKNFTLTNARASDIIYVENLTSYDNKEVLSYYVGSTSDGVYNDNSGDAYLVRYNEDGFVNVFYKGCFQNGNFDDTNAVEIVFDSSNDRYFLYQGTFVDGKRTSDDGIEYVTQNEIDTILKENECPNDLKWYFD